jgi:acetyl-CoA carboxylase biotin carboxyl carrier protein
VSDKTKDPRTFTFDKKAILQLAAMLKETELSEIEYESQGKRIRVVRYYSSASSSMPVFVPNAFAPEEGNTEQQASNILNHPGLVRSPMVGMVYIAPEPSAPPFVKVGDSVTIGQTLLIIEAMKVMNPIKASRNGTITHILVKDTLPVEYDEPLLVIE